MRFGLPVMRCDDGCGDCCGPVLCKPHEAAAVVALATSKGIKPKRQGLTCPWFQLGTCQVYEARPMVCSLFGHVAGMVCSRGHNTNVLPSLERRIMKDYGSGANVFLH